MLSQTSSTGRYKKVYTYLYDSSGVLRNLLISINFCKCNYDCHMLLKSLQYFFYFLAASKKKYPCRFINLFSIFNKRDVYLTHFAQILVHTLKINCQINKTFIVLRSRNISQDIITISCHTSPYIILLFLLFQTSLLVCFQNFIVLLDFEYSFSNTFERCSQQACKRAESQKTLQYKCNDA